MDDLPERRSPSWPARATTAVTASSSPGRCSSAASGDGLRRRTRLRHHRRCADQPRYPGPPQHHGRRVADKRLGTPLLGGRPARLIIDALFWHRLKAPLTGLYETVAADLNGSGITRGLNRPAIGDVGRLRADLMGPCIEAAVTVTLGAPKLPLVLPPAEQKAGGRHRRHRHPLGVIEALDGPRIRAADAREPASAGRAASSGCPQGRLRPGARGGRFGGQDRGRGPGRPRRPALRRRLVTVGCPRSCLPIVAALGMGTDRATRRDAGRHRPFRGGRDRACASADVIALRAGPRARRGVTTFVREVVEKSEAPLVLDADALNAFADDPALLVGREGARRHHHAASGGDGAAGRRLRRGRQNSRLGIAADVARRHRVYVVLKGYRTLIATPSGTLRVNPTSSPGMATGARATC